MNIHHACAIDDPRQAAHFRAERTGLVAEPDFKPGSRRITPSVAGSIPALSDLELFRESGVYAPRGLRLFLDVLLLIDTPNADATPLG